MKRFVGPFVSFNGLIPPTVEGNEEILKFFLNKIESIQETQVPLNNSTKSRKRKKNKYDEYIDLSSVSRPFSTTSTLPTKELTIGNWSIHCNDYDIISKFYHSKKQFVWEFKEIGNNLHKKIILNYSDIDTLSFTYAPIPNIVNNNPIYYVQMILTTNSPSKLFQETDNPSYKKNKFWTPSEDFTMGFATSSIQFHSLIFEQSQFLSKCGQLSHFEMLLLGDPYLMHISHVDPNLPPIATDMTIVGIKTWDYLLNKFIDMLKFLTLNLRIKDSKYHNLVNTDVMHKFKFRNEAKTEPAISINLDGLLNETKDIALTKEEINYFASIVKLGENGSSMFRPNEKSKNIKVALILSKERVIRICGEEVSQLWKSIEVIKIK